MSKFLTPVKAIRAYCLRGCSAGSTKAVRYCPSNDCVLYPYRMGKRPKTDEKEPCAGNSVTNTAELKTREIAPDFSPRKGTFEQEEI